MSISERRGRSTGGWRGLPLIEHLSVAAKFGLLLLFLVVPFSYSLFYQIRSNWEHSVVSARHEVAGQSLMVKVQKLNVDLEDSRFMSASYSAGNKDSKDNLAAAAQTILKGDPSASPTPAVSDVDAIDQSRDELVELGMWDKWQTLKSAVTDLENSAPSFSSDQSTQKHTEVIDQVTQFDHQISDASDMTLDPDIDTHYAIDIFLNRIPEMEHDMGLACAIMARVGAEHRKPTQAEKIDLSRLSAVISYHSEQMNHEFDKILEERARKYPNGDDPLGLKTGIGPFTTDAKKYVANFTKIANAVVLGTAKPEEAWQEAASDGIGNMSASADTFQPYMKNLLQARADESRSKILQSVGGSAVFVLLTLIIGVYIVLDIGRPLRATLQVANSIARGDLTFTIPEVRRGDEFGMLNVSLRAMVDNLREILNSIGTTVTTLTAATSEIMTTTSELAVSSTQMATAVNEATTTVEEVKQTAQVSSQRAQQVAQSAQQAAQVSQAGRQATDETLEEMNRIKDQMNSIAESVVRLNEQTQAIGEIITSVNDLAEQSNLLAVNASIEAAKAGEQGRGFAVVAQEVRHLAEQSKESTAQVRGILSEIQKATGGAVMVAEQGTKAVDLGVRQSREAGESIKTLATRVVEAAQAAVQISASTHQQLVGMDQVVTAMVGIKDGSVQTAASMRHVQTSAQRLYEMTQNLKKLTERYSST